MSRLEYMIELEALLSDIPADEREDAINYYNDYFDAGGEENEEATIASLGTPEQLARTIKLASAGATVVDGEFTETGYNDDFSPNRNEIDKYSQVVRSENRSGNNGKKEKSKMSAGEIVLIVVLAIFATPVLVPIAIAILATVFGLGIAALATIFGIAIAIVAVGVSGIIAGVCGTVGGLLVIGSNPFGAMVVVGVSLVALAIGLMVMLACVTLVVKAVPPLCKGVYNVCTSICAWVVSLFKKIFGKGKKEE